MYKKYVLGVVISLISMALGGFLFENRGIFSNQSSVAVACWLGGMLAFVAFIAGSFSVNPNRKTAG